MTVHESDENNTSKTNGLLSGIVLAAATLVLLFFINNFPQGNAKNVASLLTGMFGFTSTQAFRRSFEN